MRNTFLKRYLLPLLFIPFLSWGDVKNVERIDCLYHHKKDLVTLEIYNNNDKEIKSILINLTNKENNKVYKFQKDYSVKAYNSNTIHFWDVFFEPNKCRISDVKFKGWFN